MKEFITYLEDHTRAILLLVLLSLLAITIAYWILKCLVILIRETCYWIINIRTKDVPARATSINHNRDTKKRFFLVLGEFFIAIVNDFRHLLALIIIVLFFSLLAALVAMAGSNSERLEAIQSVAATLGGLIGSIIGFYFGEARALSFNRQSTIENSGVSGDNGNEETPPNHPPNPAPINLPKDNILKE